MNKKLILVLSLMMFLMSVVVSARTFYASEFPEVEGYKCCMSCDKGPFISFDCRLVNIYMNLGGIVNVQESIFPGNVKWVPESHGCINLKKAPFTGANKIHATNACTTAKP